VRITTVSSSERFTGANTPNQRLSPDDGSISMAWPVLLIMMISDHEQGAGLIALVTRR
jgi:hypothetical protein